MTKIEVTENDVKNYCYLRYVRPEKVERKANGWVITYNQQTVPEIQYFTELWLELGMCYLSDEDIGTGVTGGLFDKKCVQNLGLLLSEYAFGSSDKDIMEMYRLGVLAENYPEFLKTREAFIVGFMLESMLWNPNTEHLHRYVSGIKEKLYKEL